MASGIVRLKSYDETLARVMDLVGTAPQKDRLASAVHSGTQWYNVVRSGTVGHLIFSRNRRGR